MEKPNIVPTHNHCQAFYIPTFTLKDVVKKLHLKKCINRFFQEIKSIERAQKENNDPHEVTASQIKLSINSFQTIKF